jgi:glycosyltransferase involved in cell wall biosynthesis
MTAVHTSVSPVRALPGSSPTCDLSVVIPAYNEVGGLQSVVSEAREVLPTVAKTWEILIVDDGSDDGTGDTAARLSRDIPHLRLVGHPRNRGLGAALRTGYATAGGAFVCYFPADGQFPVTELKRLFPMLADHDVVLTRPTPSAKGFVRRVLSRGQLFFTNLLVEEFRWVHGIPRAFRREVLNGMDLVSDTGFLNLEFAIKAAKAGHRMVEVEIDTLPRTSGRSKVANVRTVLRTYVEMWRIRRSIRDGRV